MSSDVVHVAVGVIMKDDQVLIAKRPDHVHQGGLWEFPGGKINADETVGAALQRELAEELYIHVEKSQPLITIPHDYHDKRVFLDVHMVSGFSGEPRGGEGQEIRWVSLNELGNYQFPEANQAIMSALLLPDKYMITGKFTDFADCERKLEAAIKRGIKMIQLREKEMAETEFLELANRLHKITSASGVKLILNTSIELFAQTMADGIHFTGQRLRECQEPPVGIDKLFSTSTHTLEELQHADDLGADFAMLSPVLPTQSHPGEPALGWEKFQEIVSQVSIPVYALGGMTADMVEVARNHGAQGIAAITALWES
jgi:8-oxo-dGTP diphosphatase